MVKDKGSQFFSELMGVSAYQRAGSRRVTADRRAAQTNPQIAVRLIFTLYDCGRFDELARTLETLAPGMLDGTELSKLSESAQEKLKEVGRWYRDSWLDVEDRVTLADYSIDDTKDKTGHLLLLARGGDTRQLGKDLRKNIVAHRRNLEPNVLIYCVRRVVDSPHVTPFAVHQFYRACEKLWEEQDVLDTLVAHFDLVQGNIFLETALHVTAARLGDLEVQALARRHSGLDTSVVAKPQHQTARRARQTSRPVPPRVAVCISGMLRDADNGAAAIRRHLVEPLNADVFADVWDIEQTWFGLGGARGIGRVLGEEAALLLPPELRRISAFAEQFPKVVETWDTPLTAQLTEKRVQALYHPKLARLEPDRDFIETIEMHEGLQIEGSFNQARMFYKMNRSFALMAAHEQRQGFAYDYVIRIRPDFLFHADLTLDEVERIARDEVRVDWAGNVGPSDMFAIGRRDTMETYSELWNWMLAAKCVSPFVGNPEARSHRLLLLWLLMNEISMSVSPVKSSLSQGMDIPVPDVAEELAEDLAGPAQEHVGAPWVEAFFEAMALRGRNTNFGAAIAAPLQSLARLFRK